MRVALLLVVFCACTPGEYAPFKLTLNHARNGIDVTLTNTRSDAECLTLGADQQITWNGTPLPAAQQAWVCTASADFAIRTVYFSTLPVDHERAAEDVIELKGVFKARFPAPAGETRWLSPADGVAHAGDELTFELKTTVGTHRMMNGYLVSPTDASLGYFVRPLQNQTFTVATTNVAPHPMARFRFESEYNFKAAECTGVAECTGAWFGPVGELNLELKP
ncbi:MAG: hypothetical protein QM817_37650 [Archangium sp.]